MPVVHEQTLELTSLGASIFLAAGLLQPANLNLHMYVEAWTGRIASVATL